jgi:tetratricopeptide (TPR) repeat protein
MRYVGSLDRLDQEFADFARQRANELAPDVDWSRDGLPQRANAEQWAGWNTDHPDNYWGLRRYAQALMRAERWADAKQTLEQLHALYPHDKTSGNALELLGRVHRELGDTRAEQAVLEKLASITSDSLDTYIRLAELSADAEDWSAVAEYTRRVMSVNPLLPRGQELLSRAAENLDRHPQVVESLQALAEMDPIDPADLHFRLARSLAQLGRREEARRQVLMALEDAPRFRAAHKLLLELVDDNFEMPDKEAPETETLAEDAEESPAKEIVEDEQPKNE